MVNAYFQELSYFAPKPPPSQLLLSGGGGRKLTPPKKKPSKKQMLPQALLSYCKGYCGISSVHGFRYLTESHRYHFERVIWLLILIATTSTCFYVYTDLADLYRSDRLNTVVEDSVAAVYTRPFPAIAICPLNRINWLKALAADQRFLPNASSEAIQTFRQFFSLLSDVRFGSFVGLKPLSEPQIDLSLLDNVDVKEVMQHIGFECTEFFEHPCFWRRAAFNCCELFSFQRTEHGFCFVFNSLITDEDKEKQLKDRYYPYHNSQISEKSGLDVIAIIDHKKVHPEYTGQIGVNIIVKQQEQWHSNSYFIEPNTAVKIPIVQQYTDTDERTRSVSPDERRCLFQDESTHPLYIKPPGLLYRRSNCLTRCRQLYVFNRCKCNPDLYFPDDASDNIPICKAKDFKCFYENRELFGKDHERVEEEYLNSSFNNGMVCECLNSCNQMLYVSNYNNEPWENANTSGNIQKIHLDFHYPSRYMIRYSTRVRYTLVELLANFGGVIGLFLGASLMSVVELIYYFTIGLYIYLLERGYISDGWLAARESEAKITKLGSKNRMKQRKKFLQNNKKSPTTTSIYYLKH